jgi:hypothetical protein
LVIGIGLVAFWYLTKTDTSTAYLVADVKTTDTTDATYIYNILQQMAKVNLDDSIFSNQIFQGLKDNTVSFSPQASGRNNPFAPIGSDSGITGQSTSSQASH